MSHAIHTHQQKLRINKIYLYTGLGILIAVFLLQITPWKLQWLATLQQDEMYKRWSGIVLLLYIGFQLTLSVLRIAERHKQAKTFYNLHKQSGVVAPLFFLAHSTTLGYSYLFIQSIIFFTIIGIGWTHHEFSTIKNKYFNWAWMILHVTLSISMVLITGFHIWVAFYFQ